ncbi:MAG: 2OG-Fe(II) oxygenase [Vicinamibacteria bacterium]
MLALTRTSLHLEATPARIDAWRRSFAAAHALVWPGLLDADLAAYVRRRLAVAPVVIRTEDAREIEHTIDDPLLLGAMQAILSDPALWRLVEAVTGCPAIDAFSGRVYRREARPGGAHYFPWHSDVTDGRLIGLSVNLSDKPYDGGRLQIRDAASGRLLTDIATAAFGDAMIFRIDPALEHQVTPVAGATPRTALAGWFREGVGYWTLVR